MQTSNRILDDLARVATGAAGTVAGLRQEVESRLRERLESALRDMDLVSREEFEVVQAMAARARAEQMALTERIGALEAQVAALAAAASIPGAATPRDTPRAESPGHTESAQTAQGNESQEQGFHRPGQDV